jgi:hypothetical protein
LLLSTCKFDSIWVIMERFTKFAHSGAHQLQG